MTNLIRVVRRSSVLLQAAFCALIFLVAATVYAQTTGEQLPVAENSTQALVIAIYSALIPVAVQIVKANLPNLPRLAVLALPYVVGGVLTLLGRYTGLHGWAGFLASLGAHALYETASTVGEHKLG